MLKLEITESEENPGLIKAYLQAPEMLLVLNDIALDVFRPARKHGYSYRSKAEEACLNIEEWTDREHRIVECLEARFRELLREHNIDLR